MDSENSTNHSGLLFQDEGPRVYTVSALTSQIKDLIETQFDFIWVEGEISNFRAPSSGHFYMVLKDERSQIRAVMFRTQSRYLKFQPEDGMKVIARGRVGVYAPRGEYQIVLDYLEPLGIGALALAFEQLKKKLAAQGLFDEGKKRPLPFLPQRVAVITSPTGAAIRDFLKIIHRRFANIEIIIIPVKVQGEGATAEMVEALETVNRELKVDVIVLTRGGGSMEDLWAFNQESLALAIRTSEVPVVSAVGHEIDVTISDLVADFRAPTPSAAAELLVAEKESLDHRIGDLRRRLQVAFNAFLNRLHDRVMFFSQQMRDPRKRIADSWIRLDELSSRLIRLTELGLHYKKKTLIAGYRSVILHSPSRMITAIKQDVSFRQHTMTLMIGRKLKEHHMALSLLDEKIRNLNPISVLNRGYSITRTLPEKRVLKSASHVKYNEQVNVILAEGELECRVEKVINPIKE